MTEDVVLQRGLIASFFGYCWVDAVLWMIVPVLPLGLQPEFGVSPFWFLCVVVAIVAVRVVTYRKYELRLTPDALIERGLRRTRTVPRKTVRGVVCSSDDPTSWGYGNFLFLETEQGRVHIARTSVMTLRRARKWEHSINEWISTDRGR